LKLQDVLELRFGNDVGEVVTAERLWRHCRKPQKYPISLLRLNYCS